MRECKECGATGLYKGFREREGTAVRCSVCKGKGCLGEGHPKAGEAFTTRKWKDGINWVELTVTQDEFQAGRWARP